MRERAQQERKVRDDKKRKIDPTVSLQLYEIVSQLAFLLNNDVDLDRDVWHRTGAKTVAEAILLEGRKRPHIVEAMSKYFVRSLTVANTVYVGDTCRRNYRRPYDGGPTERLQMRFDEAIVRNYFEILAHSLGCPLATAVGLMLETCLRDVQLVTDVITQFVRRGKKLDQRRSDRIRIILRELTGMEPLPAARKRPIRALDGEKSNKDGTLRRYDASEGPDDLKPKTRRSHSPLPSLRDMRGG